MFYFPIFFYNFFLVSLIGFTGAIDSFGGSGSGYGAPSESYGAPAPAPSYGAPAPSYGAPSTSYNGATGGNIAIPVTAIPLTNGGAKYAQIYSNLGALNTLEENYGNIDYTDYNTGANIGAVNGAYTTGVGMVSHKM